MRFAIAPIVALAAVLRLAAPAVAQEPVRSFDLLNARLKPGDTVWLTDAEGREIKGTVRDLSPGSLWLKTEGADREFSASGVQAIRAQRRDSLKNGVLIGAVVGLAGGAAACLANPECSGDEAAAGVTAGLALVGAAAGAGIGALIDAAVKGPKLLVYRAPGAPGQARVSVAPVIGPRAKGVAVSFAF
jgi:hypothetical protein